LTKESLPKTRDGVLSWTKNLAELYPQDVAAHTSDA
jgi:hypothetical protein